MLFRSLGAGQSVSITLDATDETATSGQDYLELLMSAWLAAPSGLSLGSSSINPISHALTVSVTNTSGSDLQTGAQLLTFAMPTAVDSSAEGNESYAINLTSHSAKVSKGTVITTISDYSGIPGNPAVAAIPPSSQGSGGIANPPSANTNSGPSSFVPSAPQKPKSRLTEAFGSLDFETDDASASKFSKSTLADFSKTVPLSSDASKFLDRYRVQQASGARSAADPSTSVLELNLNLGQFGSSSVGDVALTTEVAATASLYINPITGEAKDNTYDPKTGLGVELIDSNSNGLVDRLKIHMRDGSPQDADGVVDGRILTSTLLADAPRQAVYRFFKQKSGVHFYTSDSVECAFLIQNSYSPGTTLESLRTNPTLNALYPEEYRFEGIAYQALETQGTALYRFYNASKGYHFLSTSTDEANTVIRNSLGAGYDVSNAVNKDPITGGWGYKYEGTSYKVSTIAQHGMDQAVYRFFNVEKGVHFYTISTEERDNVIRNSVGAAYVGQLDQARNAALLQGGWGYRFEGTAWYV